MYMFLYIYIYTYTYMCVYTYIHAFEDTGAETRTYYSMLQNSHYNKLQRKTLRDTANTLHVFTLYIYIHKYIYK